MNRFDEIAATKIAVVVYVAPGRGEAVHNNRPYHGLVINEGGIKEYRFSDGTVLRTRPGDVYYLPKGSYYRVDMVEVGGCYVINFDAWQTKELAPCVIHLPQALELFREALGHFHEGLELEVRRCIYEVLSRMRRERRRSYLPSKTEALIAPALEYVKGHYTENELSVARLAERCGISEAYLRRLFRERYGLSPKEYAISLRMDYAKRLLQSGQFAVGEVAQMCGYAEACHFSREFSKRVGIGPKEYKKTE